VTSASPLATGLTGAVRAGIILALTGLIAGCGQSLYVAEVPSSAPIPTSAAPEANVAALNRLSGQLQSLENRQVEQAKVLQALHRDMRAHGTARGAPERAQAPAVTGRAPAAEVVRIGPADLAAIVSELGTVAQQLDAAAERRAAQNRTQLRDDHRELFDELRMQLAQLQQGSREPAAAVADVRAAIARLNVQVAAIAQDLERDRAARATTLTPGTLDLNKTGTASDNFEAVGGGAASVTPGAAGAASSQSVSPFSACIRQCQQTTSKSRTACAAQCTCEMQCSLHASEGTCRTYCLEGD